MKFFNSLTKTHIVPATKAVLSLLFFCGISNISYAQEKPNLLFIMMDDLGYGQFALHNDNLTVEAFDPYFTKRVAQRQDYTPEEALAFSKRAMPTLSNLGKNGIIFTRAYAASSLCAPSRLSIATGRNLQKNGVYSNRDVGPIGLTDGTHLAKNLQDAGYATAHIGKWHIGTHDEQIVQRIVKKHRLKGTHTFSTLKSSHPEIYDEVWDAGYYGSVIREHNPLQNGFDYYYGYNTWASQFYNSPLVWENYKHAGRQAG